MNQDIFAEWLHRRGYRVVQSRTSFWFEVAPKIFQAFPFHWVISPAEGEIQELVKKHKAFSLRYSVPLDHPFSTISYHIVYQNECYELSGLSKNARYDVRKGSDYAEVKSISLERLAVEGWALQKDTLHRQGRQDAQNREIWERLCRSAIGLEGFEAWGALHEGQLVASALCFIMDDCCSILYQQSRTEHLSYCVNNVLAYGITREMLQRQGINQVFYGLQSLDAPSSVDSFKFRMGYTAKPVRQRIVFKGPLKLLGNKFAHRGLMAAQKFFPETPSLDKAEGMVRFFLQGMLPLSQQSWPDCLLNQKDEILAGLSSE